MENNFASMKVLLAGGSPLRQYFKDDLYYMKNRIRTFRSINTDDINMSESRYFEGAVTLITVLEYIGKCRDDLQLNDATIAIKSGRQSNVVVNGNVATPRYGLGHSNGITGYDYAPIVIDLMYTDYKTYGNARGIFLIGIYSKDMCHARYVGTGHTSAAYGMQGVTERSSLYTDEYLESLVDFSLIDTTDHPAISLMDDIPMNFPCVYANENGALRFCENFPIPNRFMRAVFSAISAVTECSDKI